MPLAVEHEAIFSNDLWPVFITIIILLIGNAVTDIYTKREQRVYIKDQLTLISDVSECRLVGSKEVAVEEILILSKSATEIRNTHFVSSDITQYDPKEVNVFKKVFIRVIRNGGRVHDYFGGLSPQESASVRQHIKFCSQMKKYERYHGRYVENAYPFLNFIIIDFKSEVNKAGQVVYFG